jgi:hypothetical protein
MIDVFLSRPLWAKRHVQNHLTRFEQKLHDHGFRPQTIGRNVTSFTSPFDEVVRVMRTCECAIILGLPLIRVREGTFKDEPIEKSIGLPSEWNQIEAAMSLMLGLPTLMMLEKSVSPRGLFDKGSANLFVHEFRAVAPMWVKKTEPMLIDLKNKVTELRSEKE